MKMTDLLLALSIGLLVFGACALCAKAGTVPVKAKVISCSQSTDCLFKISIGFGTTVTQPVHMCGAQPLEHRNEWVETRATEFARNKVETMLKGAKDVTLFVYVRDNCSGNNCEVRSFDRLLALVNLDGRDVNREVVEQGLAKRGIQQCGK